MKTLGAVLALAAFAGCAATTPTTTTAPRDAELAEAAFPERIAGGEEIPEVRRFNRAIEVDHDGAVNAQVEVCVSPSGDVASASLVSSSGMKEYDEALVSDVESSWKYAPFQAPADTRVCKTLEVKYNAG